MKKPSDFQKGEVYRMSPGYYVKTPYYVIINDVGEDFIETDIPLEHSLKIRFKTPTWEYQIPRMTYIGNDTKSRNLIYNQKNLYDND